MESVFFDSDIPVSSIWTKVYVKRFAIPNLVEILEAAKEMSEDIYEHEGVPELLKHQEEEVDAKGRIGRTQKISVKWSRNRKRKNDRNVKNMNGSRKRTCAYARRSRRNLESNR